MGACVLAVFAMLGVSELDRALTVSLYCFGIAIPLLTYFLEALVLGYLSGSSEIPTYNLAILVIAAFAFVVGLGAIFWHFSRNAGIMFTLLSIAAYLLLLYYQINVKADESVDPLRQ